MKDHSVARSLVKRAYRAIVGPPADDLVRAWPGTAAGRRSQRLRYLHVGDCNFRRMDHAHDTQAAPGYPRTAAEALLERDIEVDFSHYFCVRFEHLPEPQALMERIHLEEAPDLVTVHIGASYSRWIVLSDSPRSMQFRVEFGRRLGRLTWLGYRLIRRPVALLGRPASPYQGTDALEKFLRQARAAWPDARIVLVTPYPRLHTRGRQARLVEEVETDVLRAAERCRVPVLDSRDVLGEEPRLRGASAYQLGAEGAEAMGRALAEEFLRPEPTGRWRRAEADVAAVQR